MNAAVHTSARVHRCRDDVPGSSAICLTILLLRRAHSTRTRRGVTSNEANVQRQTKPLRRT